MLYNIKKGKISLKINIMCKLPKKGALMVKEIKREKCVLYERDCIGCGECEFCDLDPLKICDNCGKCISSGDFATIKIDGIYAPPKEGEYPSHKDILPFNNGGSDKH
ncbi:MAG: hypothetical protein IKJ19_07345 [Clostridia bacterium]|nr:hypothetical protein [Clostridia bacterium]